jgi:uncharacterized protein (DUF1810 family)
MPAKDDPFDLQRFHAAQAPIYERALAELRAGQKRSHWMWFVFPQLRGLGISATAQHYGIRSRAEAAAYLADPILGARLKECTEAVLQVQDRSLHTIFGSPDDLKFRSSMTLFAAAAGKHGGLFQAALDRCCEGKRDPRTLALLDAAK